jgi:PAS domain S-box-containing protein
LTVVVGILFSFGVFVIVRAWETARVEGEFQWRAGSRAQAIENILRSYEESLFAMRDVFHATHSVPAAVFETAAKAQLRRHPGLVAIEWLPLISEAEREPTERVVQQTWPTWKIRDRVDDPAPSGHRSEYLPVLYSEPMAGREAALGTDQFLGNYQRAIQRAIDSGLPAATRRVPLGFESSEAYGISMLLPVYLAAPTAGGSVPSREKIRGFVRGVFSLQELAINSMRAYEPDAIDFVVADRTPAGSEPYLFNLIGGRFGIEPPAGGDDWTSGLHADFPVSCGGRTWVVHTRPAPAWLAVHRTYYAVAFLAAGLCVTGLLASRQRQRRRRADEIERLVQTRTEELRRTQDELREDVRMRLTAEQRYRAFVEQSTEAIWHFEIEPPMPLSLGEEQQIAYVLEHAVMAECNDACARMYGHERGEEMVGTRLAQMMPRENPANLTHLRDYVRARFRLVDSESREMDREGREHIFLNNIIGIIEDDRLVRAWGMQRDVTEQRRFENERAENEKRLRLAMEAASVGTWEWDAVARRTRMSREMTDMLGLAGEATEEASAKTVERIHPDDRAQVSLDFRRAVKGGTQFESEFRILIANGETRWVVTRGDVRRNAAGEIVGMLGAALDITARKLAEEENARIEQKLQDAQKLESLGVLAGGIAHDFNNLLTGILGNASLARMDLAPSSSVQQALGQIEQAAQRAAELCKQMLAYSGKGRFVVQALDLSQFVEEASPLLQVSVSKGAVLKHRLAPDLPAVHADATQLRQILMNLVINASDAFEGRSGVIEISTGAMHADADYLASTHLSPSLPEGAYVYLEVSDNGCGMDADTQKRIFDPFFTTKFTGRGLGLAAVLGIVRGHKGALRVYSEPGRGTSFKLLLPAAEGPAEALPAEIATAEVWRGSGLVLIVDDEETVRSVTSRMAKAFGFEAVTARSGQEALGIYSTRKAEIAAVLLDLTMPHMDGAETFSELRRIDPAVKVLLMSGFNEQEAVNRFAGKGLAGFVQKPFKPDALREKLRAMLADL